MRLTMEQRSAVIAKTATRYKQAGKKEKGVILAEIVKLTEYARAYARQVLLKHGRKVRLDQRTVLVGDVRKHSSRKWPRIYDENVLAVLIRIWRIMDYICGKRLQPVLPEIVEALERHNELHCDRTTRAKLLKISAATIDRMLAPERRQYELRGRSRTKPGTLLKHQIPIRTFSEWDDRRPGFVEVDLVAHDGGQASGDYCQTLDRDRRLYHLDRDPRRQE